MEYVAHRAGNDPALLQAAVGRADTIEVDVHLAPDKSLEVRHAKVLWPTRRLWERWFLLPADTDVPSFEEILEAAGPNTRLWLDLKGVSPRLATVAAAAIEGRPGVTASSKSWWLLPLVNRSGAVRTFRSAGNRIELALLLLLPTRAKIDGVVVHHRLLSDATVRRLRRRGPVFTWAVERPSQITRLEQLGVDGVILDDLSLVPAGHRALELDDSLRDPERDGEADQ